MKFVTYFLRAAVLLVAFTCETPACNAFSAGRPSVVARSMVSMTIDGSGPLFAASRDMDTDRPTRREIVGGMAASSASILVLATLGVAQAAAPDGLVQLLVPIVEMSDELRQVQALVKDKNEWPRALKILQNAKYDKLNFKKTFNAFGDNVGNVGGGGIGGGGSAPKTEQSLAYLLRNDLLTNLDNLTAELEYLIKNEDDAEDLYKYADNVVTAMQKYLNIAPLGTLEEAQMRLSK